MNRPLPMLTVQEIVDFQHRVNITDECWEWQGTRHRKGYGLYCNHRIRFRANRIAYFIDTGIDPGDFQVCHTCDNPPCCRPSHLFLGSQGDNMRDAFYKGRLILPTGGRPPILRGADHPFAKLTDSIASTIKHSTEPGTVLAKRYGVSTNVVSHIKRGTLWKHVA